MRQKDIQHLLGLHADEEHDADADATLPVVRERLRDRPGSRARSSSAGTPRTRASSTIDRSFIHDAPEDEDAAAMVDSIIDLARRLDVVPLAEAVETQAQLSFLERRDCTLAQGYLFCRPMPADQLADRFAAGELRRSTRRIQPA